MLNFISGFTAASLMLASLLYTGAFFSDGLFNSEGKHGYLSEVNVSSHGGVKTRECYIKSIYPSTAGKEARRGFSAKVDAIEWYSGKAALNEFLKDNPGKRKEMQNYESLPEGFYIRNRSRALTSYRISPDAVIIMNTLRRDSTGGYIFNDTISIKTLSSLFPAVKNNKSRYTRIPMRLEIRNGVIVKIEEQYIP